MLQKVFFLVWLLICMSGSQNVHSLQQLANGPQISDQKLLKFKDYLTTILQCVQAYQGEKNNEKSSDNGFLDSQQNNFVEVKLSQTLPQEEAQTFIFFEQKQKENHKKEDKWIYDQISRNIIQIASPFYFANQTTQTKTAIEQHNNYFKLYFQYCFHLSGYFFYWLLLVASISSLAFGLLNLIKQKLLPGFQKIKKDRALRKKKQIIIDNFWRKLKPEFIKKSEKDSCICPICLQSSSDIKTGCQHQFHAGCLANWTKIKNNCPKCRSQILVINVICINCRAQTKQFLGQQSCWKKVMRCDACISST